jgi:hypothetical protein
MQKPRMAESLAGLLLVWHAGPGSNFMSHAMSLMQQIKQSDSVKCFCLIEKQ